MSTETLRAPQARPETDGYAYVNSTLDSIEQQAVREYELPVIIIDGAAGQNAEHAASAFRKVQLGGFALHALDIRPPVGTPHDVFHDVSTPEGRENIERIIDSGAVRAAYLSRVPKDHEPLLEKYLALVEAGKLEYVVMPKPVVETPAQARRVDVFVERAREALRLRGLDHDPLVIHEHYLMKGGFHEFIAKLDDVSRVLGRLSDVHLTIQEQTTIEAEGREAAVAGGTIEDLAPHLLSMMLAVQSATNASEGGYEIPRDFTNVTVDRTSYEGTKIKNETGFIVYADGKIIDHDQEAEHPLSITMSGGKGLTTTKKAVFTFTHPETNVATEVVVDLGKANAIVDPPEEIAHLFEQTSFEDNGYDEEVARGLVADPNEHFQSWQEAREVVRMVYGLQYLASHRPMHSYVVSEEGVSLEQLAPAMATGR